MTVLVKKWGNGASVRIPAAMMKAARLTMEQPVNVREEGGRITIEPIPAKAYDLAVLIPGITDDNQHNPVEMGPPIGQEVW